MQDGYIVSLTDEEGESFQLEVVGEVEFKGETFVVFLPADVEEDDPDYGFIILKSVEVDGEESYDSVDDEETLEQVYAIFMEELENAEDEEE